MRRDEGCFFLILFCHPNLMVAGISVEKTYHLTHRCGIN
uniref:Uncharacterized protein n=1 Tax=Arundo donax TaxID=35708 RepID=A0A0A9H397_ARUDO